MAPSPQARAPVFAALGDPCRLSIMACLCNGGPLPTMALTQACGAVTRQGMTKHLRVLESAGLIESFRRGRERLWQVRTGPMAELRQDLDRLSAEWDARLARLKALVEAP
jgi:DNA-binding transcriptional ArsR family regulator